MRFTNHVEQIRKVRGLTQSELAAMVGCSRNTISSIERLQYIPTAYTAYLICDALDCEFKEVFCFE